MELLSREDLARILCDESLQSLIQEEEDEDEESRKIEQWLEWSEYQKKNLKVITRGVPDGILPPDIGGDIIDVRVGGRGPDDKIYESSHFIRQRIARGNSVLRFKNSHGQTTYRPLIFALKKFSDDEEQSEAPLYLLKPLNQYKEIVATEKANGEAAHLGIHYFKSHGFVLCIGSKNVHLLARSSEDVEKYQEDRYAVAKVVAQTIFSKLEELSHETLQVMYSFSHYSKVTWTFELLNPSTPHVVDLSHMKSPQLNFIAWTLPDFDGNSSSLCALRPDKAFEIVREHFKLNTVSFEVVKDMNLRHDHVRRGYGYEGEVFYLIGDSNTVIGLMKTKTIWYIILRAIREKTKRYEKSEFSKNASKRIYEIQKWLNLSNNVTQQWIKLTLDFGKWLDSHSGNKDPSANFPLTWNAFLLETNSSDNISPEFQSN